MNVILDSNIIVSAFASHGLCSLVFEFCLDRASIIISEEILKESGEVLVKKITLSRQNTETIIEYLKEFCNLINPANPIRRICRDPDDDHILALAFESKCEYIITGDKDLLVLKAVENCKMISPREFWEEMKIKG
jgi:hypothetical protein